VRRQDRRAARRHDRGAVFSDNEKAVLRFTDDVVRNVKASTRPEGVQAFLTPGALVELTLTIGYYMMVCRFLETTGVEGEEGQASGCKTAKL
jgi:alkylhydroperoxidase family enzyme